MKKVLVVLLILIFVYCIGGVIYSLNIKDDKKQEDTILSINGYEYKIKNSVNDLYKNEFNKLKTNLESDNVNLNEYIKSIAKLYIIDLYSLNDKINKYDVSAAQYVIDTSRENFKLKVSETIYKYIEDKSDGERSQDLPIVTEVFVDNVNETTYKINELDYKGYQVLISWKYDKDLGYPMSADLTLIEENNIISVVSEKRIEVEQ